MRLLMSCEDTPWKNDCVSMDGLRGLAHTSASTMRSPSRDGIGGSSVAPKSTVTAHPF